jgi:hypothetical protein
MIAILAFGFVVIAQVGSPIVPSPPIETHTTTTVNLVAPAPDPAEIADAATTSGQAILNTMIAPSPIAWANDVLGLPDVWRTTPANLTYNNPAIRSLAELVRTVALSLIALAILARGLSIMLGREDASGLGRLAFAVILVLGNMVWWQWGVDLNNAICSAISAPELPSLIRPHLLDHIDPVAVAGDVILLIVYAITVLLLLFSLLFRLGLVDILIACSALALVCYATEQTEYIAAHYTRIAVAVLFGQVLVVLCLRVASVLSTLGSGGTLGTLLGIVVLLLARSAPQALLAGSANGSRQGAGWGAMAGRMILRRLGR